jgi:AraC-like DNA-binding protein
MTAQPHLPLATDAQRPRPSPRPRPQSAITGDVLSELLDGFHLVASVAGVSEMTAPWSVAHPVGTGGFFAMLDGRMLLRIDDAAPVEMLAGDVAVISHGHKHTACDSLTTPTHAAGELLTREMIRDHLGLRLGGGEPTARFVCGDLHFRSETAGPLRSTLPPLLHLPRRGRDENSPLDAVVAMLVHQAADRSAGTHALMNHLASMIFIEAVRTHTRNLIARANGQPGVLAATLDEHLGPALGLMHGSPDRDWNLASLANEAGLSRTVFHERFTATLGVAPMRYLRDLRLRTAADLIREDRLTLRDIADRVGYASEGALCSAFKKWSGRTPSEYRLRPEPSPPVHSTPSDADGRSS